MQASDLLPKEAIDEFKEIYKKKFGKELDDKEGSFRANNLFNLYVSVYGSNKKVNRKS